jgi:ACS family tartrate transporter-like MFS transporter
MEINAKGAADSSSGSARTAEAANVNASGTVGKRALGKAGARLIPMIALGYGMTLIDRNNISYAALEMNRDLHFSATMYGLGAGLFFLSYAVCQVPSNVLLCRYGARRWLAGIMLVWGLVATGMVWVRTPAEFYGMRLLLGMAEAGYFPGVVFYLSEWFPSAMRARAVSRFYIAWPISTVVMGMIAGALLSLQGRLGLAGWQWLFLVEGMPAVMLSLAFLAWLPDAPADAKWLTTEERVWLVGTLAEENKNLKGKTAEGEMHGAVTNGGDILHALVDARVLAMGALTFCMLICSYAYMLTAPAILQEVTGFSATKVGYLVAWMTVLGAPCMLANAAHSDRTGERYWHVIIPFALMMCGYVVAGLSHNVALVVAALTVTGLGNFVLQGPLWGVATRFFSGKRSAMGIATMNMIGILGGFIGPYWIGIARDLTGNYKLGLLTLALPSFMGGGIMLMMRQVARSKEEADPSSLRSSG